MSNPTTPRPCGKSASAISDSPTCPACDAEMQRETLQFGQAQRFVCPRCSARCMIPAETERKGVQP